MIRKSASELEIGMTLCQPVHDMQGVLLLNAGTVITAKNIQVLKAWGVTRVWIEGEAQEGEGGENTPGSCDQEEIEKELSLRFGETLRNPVMVSIMKTAAKLIAERPTD